MDNRIYGEIVDIDSESVQNFYDCRAQNVSGNTPYSAVLLSDHAPELIEEQMKIEEELLFPRLKISTQSRVLDIGCGIGRWAERIIPVCDYYYGIDFSQNMIDIAKKRISRLKKNNYAFENMSFQKLTEDRSFESDTVVTSVNGEDFGVRLTKFKFNHVIISGILMYICDHDIRASFSNLRRFLDETCVIFVWEPCGIGQRLTLKDFPSEALNGSYNVIYRTRSEYDDFFKIFMEYGFNITFSEYYSALGGTVTYTDTDKIYYILER